MQKFIKTSGIIIQRRNYNDADKILTIFTREHGKISAVANGIRKISSRKKSHLELLNYSNIYLVATKGLPIITQAETINSRKDLKNDLDKIRYSYLIMELLNQLTAPDVPNENLFKLTSKTLDVLENNKLDLNILNAYILKLLVLMGFASLNEFDNSTSQVKSYLKTIGRLISEELCTLDIPEATKQNAYLFLIDKVEEIIEKKIKTKISL